MLLAQLDTATLLPLVDRFGFAILTCGAFAVAIRALWQALQAKETAHRDERLADRSAHLAALADVAGIVKTNAAQIGEIRRDVERIADRTSPTPLRATGAATLATLVVLAYLVVGSLLLARCSRTVDTAMQIDAAATSTSSSSSSSSTVAAAEVDRARTEAPSTTTTHTVVERFLDDSAAETFDPGAFDAAVLEAAERRHAAEHVANVEDAISSATRSTTPVARAREAGPSSSACASSSSCSRPPRLIERTSTDTTTTTGAVLETTHAGMSGAASTVQAQAGSSSSATSGKSSGHTETHAGFPWSIVLVVVAALVVVVLVARRMNWIALAKRFVFGG